MGKHGMMWFSLRASMRGGINLLLLWIERWLAQFTFWVSWIKFDTNVGSEDIQYPTIMLTMYKTLKKCTKLPTKHGNVPQH